MNDDTKRIIAASIGAGLAGAIGAAIKSVLEKSEAPSSDGNHSDDFVVAQSRFESENASQIFQEQKDDTHAENQVDDAWNGYLHNAELKVQEEKALERQSLNKGENTIVSNAPVAPTIGLQYTSAGGNKKPMAENKFEVGEVATLDKAESDAKGNMVIDNAALSFSNQPICIRLNDRTTERRNKLKVSESVLIKRFPAIKSLSSENRLQQILDGVFPDGFQKRLYIRNLSFDSASGFEYLVMAIRPEIYEDDFLSQLLPSGCSLLFKGHLSGKVFTVDGIYEVADTERLCYEAEGTATPYNDVARIGNNFLYDIRAKASSLTRYTQENLDEWKAYLNWKKELAKRQIFGCKYYKITFDDSGRLVFWLVCKSREYFQDFKKYLYRDVQAFNNDYSSDMWIFQLAETNIESQHNSRKKFDRSIELGRCRGVIKEYYLEPDDAVDVDDASVDVNERDNTVEDTVETEIDIRKAFETPYIVQVAYELNRSNSDDIIEKNIESGELADYVRENVIGNYYPNGFLALSAVGDFVLIDRFQQAISQLERDECYSPNLATWLFNVQQARLPDIDATIQIDKWLNVNIEKNENQKEAVRKMLIAPDLCLIQGPPGTGKTTVIAEAIYQFVRRGNRVLIASQSNDAVDNALERLANTPEIRAIRLGQKGRRKKSNNNSDLQMYSEDTALLQYYHALSRQIFETWLDRWADLESRDSEFSRDIRDASMFNQDISELSSLLLESRKSIRSMRKSLAEQKMSLSASNETNLRIQNELRQLQNFEDVLQGNDSAPFYLSDAQVKCVEPELNPVISFAITNGIQLFPAELNLDVITNSNTESRYIFNAFHLMSTLVQLKTSAIEAESHASGSEAEVKLLQMEINNIRAEIDEALIEDDDDLLRSLKKEFQQLKLKIDRIKNRTSAIDIRTDTRGILTQTFLDMLNSDKRSDAISIITELEERWNSAVTRCLKALTAYSENQRMIETEVIIESIRVLTGRVEDAESECNRLSAQIEKKRGTLTTLAEKYHIDNIDTTAIIESIRQLQKKNTDILSQQQQMRADWESTLREFTKRLNDTEAFVYDHEHFQPIYINACNVVGISCTDNMRNLSDKGYDDFDVVIIDEVSKATPPELLIPLMKARKAILVGDHRQLPPMFKEHEGSYEELVKNQEEVSEEIRGLLTVENFNRFKHMVTASLFKEYFENADVRIKHSLLVQYRMHSDIMDIINRFYDRRLSTGLSTDEENKLRYHGLTINAIDGSSLIVPKNHAYWIDSSALPSGQPLYESFVGKSTSACNFLEVHIIIELLKKIADAYRVDFVIDQKPHSLGVISFYQSQVREIRDALKIERKKFDFSPINIDVNTVDRFQGKEKSIVITSLVRNNKNAKASEHVIAFERINVAFSRAQNLLVIVGAKHMYEGLRVQLPNVDAPGYKTVPIYKNIMDDLNRKACFRSCDKLISAELERMILRRIQESG